MSGLFALLPIDLNVDMFSKFRPVDLKIIAKCSRVLKKFIKERVISYIHNKLHPLIGIRMTSDGNSYGRYIHNLYTCDVCSAYELYVPGLSNKRYDGSFTNFLPCSYRLGGYEYIFKRRAFGRVCYACIQTFGDNEIPEYEESRRTSNISRCRDFHLDFVSQLDLSSEIIPQSYDCQFCLKKQL